EDEPERADELRCQALRDWHPRTLSLRSAFASLCPGVRAAARTPARCGALCSATAQVPPAAAGRGARATGRGPRGSDPGDAPVLLHELVDDGDDHVAPLAGEVDAVVLAHPDHLAAGAGAERGEAPVAVGEQG